MFAFELIRKKLLLLLFLLLPIIVYSQKKIVITGIVIDSAKNAVEGASVTVKENSSSYLTATTPYGYFLLVVPLDTSLNIAVTYLGYESAFFNYSINLQHKLDTLTLGAIKLKRKNILLTQVLIKSKSPPIILKKDTTEYDAASFLSSEDNVVKDLLRHLPGIIIDKNGNITYQGDVLTKLTVNGVDFFTGNINEYIQQLPAAIVSKLQVVNDYGNESKFSGIKSGIPVHTLNLIFKPNINSGLFGMAMGENQTTNISKINGNINSWRNTRQLEINTTGTLGNDVNGVSFINGAGLSYKNTISKKIYGSFDYSYNRISTKNTTTTLNKTLNENDLLITRNSNTFNDKSLNQNVIASITLNGLKNSFFSFSPILTFASSNNNSQSSYLENGINDEEINSNQNMYSTTPMFGCTLVYDYRFKKTGRVINMTANFNSNKSESTQNVLNDINYLFNTRIIGDSLSENQYSNIVKSHRNTFQMQYIEPLTSVSSILLTYNFDKSQQIVNFTASEKLKSGYLAPVDSLTTFDTYSTTKEKVGINYKYENSKLTGRFGINFQSINTTTLNFYNASVTSNTAFEFSPEADLQYLTSKHNEYSIYYQGYSTTPSYTQLQSTPNNSNIENIIVGNPNLKPSFTHSLRFNFRRISTSGNTFMINTSLTYVNNKISDNTFLITDTLHSNQLLTSYSNINGTYGCNINYQMSLTNLKIYNLPILIVVAGGVIVNNNASLSNNTKISNKETILNQEITAQLMHKSYEATLRASYQFQNSIFNTIKGKFLPIETFTLYANNNYPLGKKIKLGIEISELAVKGYQGFNIPSLETIINLSVSSNAFRGNKGQYGIHANDLFNQANNFSWYTSGNSIISSKKSLVTRYVSVFFKYSFSNFHQRSGSKTN